MCTAAIVTIDTDTIYYFGYMSKTISGFLSDNLLFRKMCFIIHKLTESELFLLYSHRKLLDKNVV